jgi:uroporphyrinogen decarboxylase
MTTKRGRLQDLIAGRDTDRPPLSFWTHFPGIDLDPDALASTTVAFARKHDIDLVKSMPNGFFCTEDWGVTVDFSAINSGGVATVASSPIERPHDWSKIGRSDVTAGAFGRELGHLSTLVGTLGSDWPVIATVFSPLTVAKKIAGAPLAEHLETHPHEIAQALQNIAETMADFSRRAIALGCAGVFFAVQDATAQIGVARYRRWGEATDRIVLEGARAGWLNTIHMHGHDILFDVLKDYPVDVLNWHIGETAPTIAAYRAAGGNKPILGGLRRKMITDGDLDGIRKDIADARAVDGGRGIIFAPGCVIRHPVHVATLQAIAAEVRRPA